LTDLSHATIAAVTTRHIRTLLKSLQIHPSINPYFYIIPTLQLKAEIQRHQCMPEESKRTPEVNITVYMHKFSGKTLSYSYTFVNNKESKQSVKLL